MHYSVPMTSNHFLTAARTLAAAADEAGFPLSAHALLNITEALVNAGANFATPPAFYDLDTHEGRVVLGLATPGVIAGLREGKVINAIKALRTASLVNDGVQMSLLDAKNAVEDPRLKGTYYRWS